MFVYVMIGRFYSNFHDFWQNLGHNTSIDTSRGLLLDLCPFCAFVLPICLICDPTRKAASTISYFAIFGGLVTLIGGICFNNFDSVNAKWDAKWIFLGDSENKMYFMIHFLQVIFGGWVLLNSKRVIWKDFVNCLGFIAVYFAYVLICIHTLHVTENATGLVPNDWGPDGEYGDVSKLFHLSFPWVMIVGFTLVAIFIVLTMVFYWLIQKGSWYKPERVENIFKFIHIN
jgi:hypothetical protein